MDSDKVAEIIRVEVEAAKRGFNSNHDREVRLGVGHGIASANIARRLADHYRADFSDRAAFFTACGLDENGAVDWLRP